MSLPKVSAKALIAAAKRADARAAKRAVCDEISKLTAERDKAARELADLRSLLESSMADERELRRRSTVAINQCRVKLADILERCDLLQAEVVRAKKVIDQAWAD